MTAALVENGVRAWGLLDGRPTSVNPMAERAGRRRSRLRLKEWIGWTLVHPEMSCSMILQDAHYLASTEIYVRDAASGRLTEHARNLRGGSLHLPEVLFGSNPGMAARGYRLEYLFGELPGSHTINGEMAATKDGLPVSVRLALNEPRSTAPLSVSQPLGRHGAMYTHKKIYPVVGEVTVGDRTYVFDPHRDLAILDEHKSFLPYRTAWLWGTFATMASDGILGANLCAREAEPGTPGESCAWLPGPEGSATIPLDAPVFTPTSADRLAPWTLTTGDGRVDLVFEPEGRKDVRHQLVLVAIDYFQLYGTYSGTVAGRPVEGVRGVLESMNARL